MVSELVGLTLELVVLGCRPGSDLRLQTMFEELETSASPIYLGRLGLQHAVELAKRVDPVQAKSVAQRVLSIAHKEGLARTPLSLTLLIIGVVSDSGWINAVSNTSFIDAFVDSLLGRGGFRDDMRLQIDSAGYSRVLEALAKKLIEDDSASISHIDLINFYAKIVSNLDWSDKPEDVIRSLIYKGILVDRDGTVKFRQSAYLHIFAARAARLDPMLVERLKRRPLYYSTIIRNYAALQRSDQGLVEWASDMLSYIETESRQETGMYGRITDAELKANVEDVAKLAELGADSQEDAEDVGRLTTVATDGSTEHDRAPESQVLDSGSGAELSDSDPYDAMLDNDREPFPSSDLENAPIDIRMEAQLALVSNILRDSELVENPALKEAVLDRTLRAWGVYMNYVYESPTINAMVNQLAEVIGERLEFSDERSLRFKARLTESWSMFSALVGIGENLATIKLQRALKALRR